MKQRLYQMQGQIKQITLLKDSVILDDSTPSDPDEAITSYNWTKIAGLFHFIFF